MKSKHEIPSKYDSMKTHSFNFLQNEIGNTGVLHEKNVGKTDTEFGEQGQERTEKPSISKSQDNLENNMDRADSSRTHESFTERTEASILTDSRTDYNGSAPKRYTTKCYIKPVPVPIWYTESVFLTIGSTRRRYEDKVYIKNKLRPFKWTENMHTEVKTMPKNIISEIYIPAEESDVHYMSLEPQQILAAAN